MIGITIEHDEIVRWTASRGGKPVLRSEEVEFPAISFEQELHDGPVSWDHWLAAFDTGEFAFIYQDATANGELSRFWKIVPRFADAAAAA
jgi:hypothetical protein